MNEQPHAGAPVDESAQLNRTFFALSDPTRRAILEALQERPKLVSELAAPFAMSVQAISQHIKILVNAGLVVQARTGRISRCQIEAGPLLSAAVWINRYSEYWQSQFDTLAGWLSLLEQDRATGPATQRSDTTPPKPLTLDPPATHCETTPPEKPR